MKSIRGVASLLLLLLAMMPAADAQTVSGQISGRVVDPGGSVVPGANVRLTSDLTQQVREFITDSSGSFIFASLVPGNYSVRVENPGFKAYDQSGVHVSAQERVDLHDIKLQLGEVATTVQVQAEAAHVATDSSARNINVTRLHRRHADPRAELHGDPEDAAGDSGSQLLRHARLGLGKPDDQRRS